MSRKTFIESQAATCRNWNWSWSFINEKMKFIIFGAWDRNTEGSTALIFDEAWERNAAGRKNPAYPEAREHIRLVEEALCVKMSETVSGREFTEYGEKEFSG